MPDEPVFHQNQDGRPIDNTDVLQPAGSQDDPADKQSDLDVPGGKGLIKKDDPAFDGRSPAPEPQR